MRKRISVTSKPELPAARRTSTLYLIYPISSTWRPSSPECEKYLAFTTCKDCRNFRGPSLSSTPSADYVSGSSLSVVIHNWTFLEPDKGLLKRRVSDGLATSAGTRVAIRRAQST